MSTRSNTCERSGGGPGTLAPRAVGIDRGGDMSIEMTSNKVLKLLLILVTTCVVATATAQESGKASGQDSDVESLFGEEKTQTNGTESSGQQVTAPEEKIQPARTESEEGQKEPAEASGSNPPVTSGTSPVAPEGSPATSEASGQPPSEIAAEPVSGKHSGIEEIVVTAQKRAENLQEVPIAIQAFSADYLGKQAVKSTMDLQSVVPSLIHSTAGGIPQAFIRGVGQDSYLPTADPGVATYVDGVFMPTVQGTVQSASLVERMEVLKGPQGTLYGRNATGGAINIITRDPSQEFEWNANLGGGSFKSLAAGTYINMPITSQAAASLGLAYDRREPYETQVNPNGPKLVNTTNEAVRGKVLVEPINDFKAVFSGYFSKHFGLDTDLFQAKKLSPLLTAAGAQPNADHPNQINSDSNGFADARSGGLGLKATYSTPWFDVIPITGYNDILAFTHTDFDATPLPVFNFNAPRPRGAFSRSLSQELQFVSNQTGNFDWIVGGFYYNSFGGFDPLQIETAPGIMTNLIGQINDSLVLHTAVQISLTPEGG